MRKIIIFASLSFCILTISCNKQLTSNETIETTAKTEFANEQEVVDFLQNSEWVDHYVVDQYIYFDNQGNIYTNYMIPGEYNTDTVIKYKVGQIKFINSDNGEQSATFDLGNQYAVHLSAKKPNEMLLLDTAANGDDAIRIIKKVK